MKNLLIVSNVVTLLALAGLLLSRYGTSPTPPPSPGSGTVVAPITDPPGPCTQQLETPTPMGSQNAINLVGNYVAHWQLINAGNPAEIKDTRSVWFSLGRLKGFIRDIENKSANMMAVSGATMCCQTLGIRIYFGEYNADLVDTFFGVGVNTNYVGRTTVLMVPTYRWSSDGMDHDFNPNYYKPTYSATAVFNCTPPNDSMQWTVPIEALTMNHGGIVPPPYPSLSCQVYKGCGADFMIYAVDAKNPGFNPYYNLSCPTNPLQ